MEMNEWLNSRNIDVTTARRFELRQASKDSRPCVRYPSTLGVERVRFIDDQQPKYKWAARGGHPTWYGLKEALEHDGPIYIVNGEPSVWAAWQYGVAAVCTLGGESNYPTSDELVRLATFGRQIKIVFDLDEAGRKGSQGLANAFANHDVDAEIRSLGEAYEQLALEHEIERKGFDVDDLARIVQGGLKNYLFDLGITPIVIDQSKPVPQDSAQVTIAQTVLQRLKSKNGPPLVFSGGGFWKYSSVAGVWGEVGEHLIDKETVSLNGVSVSFGEDPKPLKINASTISGVRQCAEIDAYEHEFFDEPKEGIAFANGFLSTKTWILSPHDPDNRAQFSTGCQWDANAVSPTLEKMLHTYTHLMEPDEAHKFTMQLQEMFGCVAAGINGYTYWLTGNGDNGKSACLDLVAELVAKELRCSINPKLLSDPNVSQYYVAQLHGKRLNIDADIPESEILDSSEWKKSVTGDYITGRNPAGKPFQFRPKIIHLFSANALPSTKDHSDGFWRRSVVIPMHMPIPKEMQVEGIAALIGDKERAGLFAWAVAGARRYLANGKKHTTPQCSVDEKARWQRDADQILLFAELFDVIEDESEGIPGNELHKVYTTWAQESGFGKLNITNFGKRVAAVLPKKRTSYGVRYMVKRQAAPSRYTRNDSLLEGR